eukprot:1158281-Pelagomonas_calceolata.AAC.14
MARHCEGKTPAWVWITVGRRCLGCTATHLTPLHICASKSLHKLPLISRGLCRRGKAVHGCTLLALPCPRHGIPS